MIEISLQNHLWYLGFQIDLGGVTTLRLGFAWIKKKHYHVNEQVFYAILLLIIIFFCLAVYLYH